MKVKAHRQRDDDLAADYARRIKATPLLSPEEERELSRRSLQGDPEARRRLVEANLRLVMKLAHQYASQGVPLADLIQEGSIGLMRAAEKYDGTRGVRFSTCAALWIRQAINHCLKSTRRAIRLSCRDEDLIRRMARTSQDLRQDLGREPRSGEIARRIGAREENVEALLPLMNDPVSLDAGVSDDGQITALDLQPDYTYNPERELLRRCSRDAARQVYSCLKERERRGLAHHYQFSGCERLSLKKIGDRMGISAEAVRQIERRALNKLRVRAVDLDWNTQATG